jgi:hypothetical protein
MAGSLRNELLLHCDQVYRGIAARSEDATRSAATYTGYLAAEPKRVSTERWSSFVRQHAALSTWQQTCLDLFTASLSDKLPACIAEAVLGHVPDQWGYDHHRRLPKEFIGYPTFYRTDQTANGLVLKVQCPGSLWGVHEILLETYETIGLSHAGQTARLSEGFAAGLRARRTGETPIVHHLLDNASHPAGERFFIQRARKHVNYFSFDCGVRPQDCNFVRGHDYPSLLAESFAKERIQRLIAGDSVYDLPPVALFDQKLLLAFPFWDVTRSYFSDAVRSVFPYTTVLSPAGLRLENGDWISLECFASLPRAQRGYFLKYAGSDNFLNWGSRAVFHLGKLSQQACQARLLESIRGFDAGVRWIVQRECVGTDNVAYFSRAGDVLSAEVHDKHSVFYGPEGPLGLLVMFESFYKVHGSTETICTVGIHDQRPAKEQVP